MDTFRQYILSIISAAVICSIITQLAGKKEAYASIIKLLCGIFMAITIVSPLGQFKFPELVNELEAVQQEADALCSESTSAVNSELSALIKAESEAYILDKATELGLDIQVDMTMDISDIPIPSSLVIKGAASPQAKQKLQQIIESDLGIPEDKQVWN